MPKAIRAPDSRGEPSVEVEAVLDLLVEAIWTDVMGEMPYDGPVPEGTEPCVADGSESVDKDEVVQRPTEAARCAR